MLNYAVMKVTLLLSFSWLKPIKLESRSTKMAEAERGFHLILQPNALPQPGSRVDLLRREIIMD